MKVLRVTIADDEKPERKKKAKVLPIKPGKVQRLRSALNRMLKPLDKPGAFRRMELATIWVGPPSKLVMDLRGIPEDVSAPLISFYASVRCEYLQGTSEKYLPPILDAQRKLGFKLDPTSTHRGKYLEDLNVAFVARMEPWASQSSTRPDFMWLFLEFVLDTEPMVDGPDPETEVDADNLYKRLKAQVRKQLRPMIPFMEGAKEVYEERPGVKIGSGRPFNWKKLEPKLSDADRFKRRARRERQEEKEGKYNDEE